MTEFQPTIPQGVSFGVKQAPEGTFVVRNVRPKERTGSPGFGSEVIIEQPGHAVELLEGLDARAVVYFGRGDAQSDTQREAWSFSMRGDTPELVPFRFDFLRIVWPTLVDLSDFRFHPLVMRIYTKPIVGALHVDADPAGMALRQFASSASGVATIPSGGGLVLWDDNVNSFLATLNPNPLRDRRRSQWEFERYRKLVGWVAGSTNKFKVRTYAYPNIDPFNPAATPTPSVIRVDTSAARQDSSVVPVVNDIVNFGWNQHPKVNSSEDFSSKMEPGQWLPPAGIRLELHNDSVGNVTDVQWSFAFESSTH